MSEVSLLRRLIVVLGMFVAIILVGTTGYILLEGWPWTDALYMTLITISTVGFGEIRPLSEQGRMFTAALIVMGVGGAAYTFSTVADYLIAGELRGVLRRQRMQKRIRQMQGHYIVCGFGRMGRQVAGELMRNESVDVVVVERNPELLEAIERLGAIPVHGDAAADGVLEQAGIERAAGLCVCLPHDADNVFTVLSARTLNRTMTIIARANSEESERKLRIAGATHVINPYAISGRRMARQLIHPSVMEFMDVVMHQGQVEFRIEEIQVKAGSSLDGKTLEECNVRRRTGVNVLAVRRPTGEILTNLAGDFLLRPGDVLIGLGTPKQLEALSRLAEEA